MHIQEATLDDLMFKMFSELLKGPFSIDSTRGEELGKLSERFGVMLELTNPRARLSKTETRGKTFSTLGEFLWYLSGDESLKFIKYYISKYEDESFDGKTIYGAYGPRLVASNGKFNQINNIITLLKNNPTSKRAAMQIFEFRDIDGRVPENKITIPCTCTLQFLLRDNRLSLLVFMRSNDAYIGLPHDVFAFTMLQELVASEIGADLGVYKHCVGSMHLYKNNIPQAEQYIGEGVMSTKNNMPLMPKETPMESVKLLLDLERDIRLGNPYDIEGSDLALYWRDFAYLLAIYSHARQDGDGQDTTDLKSKLSTKIYDIYLNK